ncbi:MAG: hypothetical protein AAF940_00835 [Pseudomonadota bacterium]
MDFVLTPRKDHAFVFDVYDKKERKLSRSQFYRMFGDELATAFNEGRVAPKSAERIPILIEGDSWTNLLWPLSAAFGFERNFCDVIELEQYSDVENRGWPGDTLENIVAEKDYEALLKAGQRAFFIFSAAGNDVLGGGSLKKFVRNRSAINPSEPVENWIVTSEMNKALRRITLGYRTVARECEVWTQGKTRMLVHGYDYPIARENGVWLGTPFAELGYDLASDRAVIDEILRHLVDKLYATLHAVAAIHPNVKVINLRGLVAGRWTDELHTAREASEDIAAAFLHEMTASLIS